MIDNIIKIILIWGIALPLTYGFIYPEHDYGALLRLNIRKISKNVTVYRIIALCFSYIANRGYEFRRIIRSTYILLKNKRRM